MVIIIIASSIALISGYWIGYERGMNRMHRAYVRATGVNLISGY
jgi:hypothetical protein